MKHVTITEPGELTYLITELVNQALKDKVVNYTLLNAVIGSIECSKLEFYRRIVSKYEDKKQESNGEVYKCLSC